MMSSVGSTLGRRDLALDDIERGAQLDGRVAARQLKKTRQVREKLLRTMASSGGIKQLFAKLDTDHSGTISLRELRSSLNREGMHGIASDIKSCMDVIDSNGDGQISFNELNAFLREDQLEVDPRRQLKAVDHIISKEVAKYSQNPRLQTGTQFRSPLYKPGGATVDEFQRLLRQHYKVQLDTSDLLACFKKYDVNGHGLFDFMSICDSKSLSKRKERVNKKVDQELANLGLDCWGTLTPGEKETRKSVRRKFQRSVVTEQVASSNPTLFERADIVDDQVDKNMEHDLKMTRGTMLRRRMIQRLASASNIKALFRRLDSDGNGSVDIQEFRHGIMSMGIMGASHINLLFNEIDVNRDGMITRSELEAFLAADPAVGVKRRDKHARPEASKAIQAEVTRQTTASLATLASLQNRLQKRLSMEKLTLDELFYIYDDDHNGWLDQQEVGVMLESLGLQCSIGELYAMYDVMKATKGDRRITPGAFEDFILNFKASDPDRRNRAKPLRKRMGEVSALLGRRASTDGPTRAINVEMGTSVVKYSAFVRRILQVLDGYLTVTGYKVMDVFRFLGGDAAGVAKVATGERVNWTGGQTGLDSVWDELTRAQFHQMLHLMGIAVLIPNLDDPEELDDFFSVVDTDGDDKISVQELNHCLRHWRRAEAQHKSRVNVTALKKNASQGSWSPAKTQSRGVPRPGGKIKIQPNDLNEEIGTLQGLGMGGSGAASRFSPLKAKRSTQSTSLEVEGRLRGLSRTLEDTNPGLSARLSEYGSARSTATSTAWK
jgi:Ca2+-binding EF-hand superfamily protein